LATKNEKKLRQGTIVAEEFVGKEREKHQIQNIRGLGQTSKETCFSGIDLTFNDDASSYLCSEKIEINLPQPT
jgi:hypothetical protein